MSKGWPKLVSTSLLKPDSGEIHICQSKGHNIRVNWHYILANSTVEKNKGNIRVRF